MSRPYKPKPDNVHEQTVEIPVPSGGTVVGILTWPTTVDQAPRGSRVVVIAHGLAGHKDNIFQANLARTLPVELGLVTFRFDFRNAGDSSEIPANVKVMDAGQEDLDTVINGYLLNERKFALASVVGHSRGATGVFLWALRNQDKILVPSIVNCSTHFTMDERFERMRRIKPEVDRDGGAYFPVRRYGKSTEQFFSADDLNWSQGLDMDRIRSLEAPVLSIFGSEEDAVNLEDVNKFEEALGPQHTVRIVLNANHNFFKLDPEGSRKKVADLGSEVVDHIVRWLDPDRERERFMAKYGRIGAGSRWRPVDGIANLRDFGGFTGRDGKAIRPGYLFRAAVTTHLTDLGYDQLKQDLEIGTVFDLRSEAETTRQPGAKPGPDLDVRWTPVFKNMDASPQVLAKRHASYRADPVHGFQVAYQEILEKGGPAFREIFLHIRDKPNRPFLVHCTAGKDRTGVASALILLLMGVHPDIVSREYELTTEGMADEWPRLIEALRRNHEDDPESHNTEGLLNFLSSKYGAMRGTIQLIEDEFGGVEEYLKKYCQLTDNDLERIRGNLQVNPNSRWKFML